VLDPNGIRSGRKRTLPMSPKTARLAISHDDEPVHDCLRLAAVEVDHLAVLKVRAPTIVGAVVLLAGTVRYNTACDWRNAVTFAVF
jgi:hypothetical protein